VIGHSIAGLNRARRTRAKGVRGRAVADRTTRRSEGVLPLRDSSLKSAAPVVSNPANAKSACVGADV
jgi:hypothetical protein